MAEDYLLINPLDLIQTEIIFINNYIIHIKAKIKDRIEAAENPSVEVLNANALIFNDGLLTVILQSKYVNENNVDRITGVDLVISVPEFDDVKAGLYDVRSYIEFQNWNN